MFGGYCKKTETLKAEWHDRFRQWIPTECLDGTHKYQNSLKKERQDIWRSFHFCNYCRLKGHNPSKDKINEFKNCHFFSSNLVHSSLVSYPARWTGTSLFPTSTEKLLENSYVLYPLHPPAFLLVSCFIFVDVFCLMFSENDVLLFFWEIVFYVVFSENCLIRCCVEGPQIPTTPASWN